MDDDDVDDDDDDGVVVREALYTARVVYILCDSDSRFSGYIQIIARESLIGSARCGRSRRFYCCC